MPSASSTQSLRSAIDSLTEALRLGASGYVLKGSPASEVCLEVRKLHEGVRIDVQDRGPGMSDTVLTNALVPFYSTKRSGTGLGLALAREIAEAHGGRITLGNREGGGLTVTMLLPLA